MDREQQRQTEILESIEKHVSNISEDLQSIIERIATLDERVEHLEKITSDILNQ